MKKGPSRLFFDAEDYKLLGIVNDVLERGVHPASISLQLAPYLHPHGIEEMAASVGLRIAYAVVGLLGSLETGRAPDRLVALRCLMDEVFSSSTGAFYQKNTARLLIQIMKELVRNQGRELEQLQLAHDFRRVITGKPRLIRRELAKYYLLEMPEEWNQFSFDDHVHDANTKGRKSPTHLLLDAWIKGIRKLTVVYYNHVEQEVVEELLEASAILDIHVRIGIEFSSPFRGRFVRFIWELEGFLDNHSLLQFFREQAVRDMLDEGRQVSHYQQRYVFDVLEEFNRRHRLALNKELSLESEPLAVADFIHFVGAGQPSLLHLAKYIQMQYRRLLEAEVCKIRQVLGNDPPLCKKRLALCAEQMQGLAMETLMERFLAPACNPNLHDPSMPHESMPPLMRLNPQELLGRLISLHANSRFTLNLNRLSIQDTLELLYLCKGRITHLESFNLKDANYGTLSADPCRGEAAEQGGLQFDYQILDTLQKALNDNNVIALKRVIRLIIWDFDQARLTLKRKIEQAQAAGREAEVNLATDLQGMEARKAMLLNILLNIEELHKLYSPTHPLGSRIGSGSTGQSQLRYGMGLAVLSTLPKRAAGRVLESQNEGQRKLIPVTAHMIHHQHRRDRSLSSSLLGSLSGSGAEGRLQNGERWSDWTLDRFEIHPGREGNIVALGGARRLHPLDLDLGEDHEPRSVGLARPTRYLNSRLRNVLKVLLGFIPAFLTFFLTKDWWFLAYCGAFIWFGITGVRNIIQAVLGGGGLRRSPLLPWGVLVNWGRIADSLFFTGLSVPLLDFVIKTLLLERQMGVTIATNPLLLYAVMSLANSIYISTHNILRGLPKGAVVGNLFRSVLAIPLSILFNTVIGGMLTAAGVPLVNEVLQKWAAVISKLASDCVAAVIEGLADRQNNIRVRLRDYREKLAQLFAVFSRFDMLFPEEDVLDLLQKPKELMAALPRDGQDLEKIFIVNALDLMYIWMYQPRAGKALQRTVVAMSAEEWLIFYRSQLVLKRTREISQLFVDGLVGKNFARALSFYLDRSESYLNDMARLGEQRKALLGKRGIRQIA